MLLSFYSPLLPCEMIWVTMKQNKVAVATVVVVVVVVAAAAFGTAVVEMGT